MAIFYLGAFGRSVGDRKQICDLTEFQEADHKQLSLEIPYYRYSIAPVWMDAVVAGTESLAQIEERLAAVVYTTQSDRDTTTSLARLLDEFGAADSCAVAISGHECGNLGPTLRQAASVLTVEPAGRVLMVFADQAGEGARILRNQASVFSDGAVSVVASREPLPGPGLEVEAVAESQISWTESCADPLQATVRLARLINDELEAALRAKRREGLRGTHLVLPNYREATQHFLAAALGLVENPRVISPYIRDGHSFAADIIATVAARLQDGTLTAGDRITCFAMGPWSAVGVVARVYPGAG